MVLSDPEVARWYGTCPTLEDVEKSAQQAAWAWRYHGVHKWLAYDRLTGDVVGRGGCSRVPVDQDWGRLYAFLPDAGWVREPHSETKGVPVHDNWVEIGWALRGAYWRNGYATEIGEAGLRFAFTELSAQAVVSCTEPHNLRSRGVMERIGLRYAGEIGGDGPVEGIPDNSRYTVHILLRAGWRGVVVPKSRVTARSAVRALD